MIVEVSAPEAVKMGSIGGGGRYDDLTSTFGLKNMSGVGISFGLDRIFIVMDSLNLFPKTNNSTIKVLFTNTNSKYIKYITSAVSYLRKNNINTDFYPDTNSLKKQLKYANNKH